MIAAIQGDKWQEALKSPVQVLFYLPADLLTVKERVQQAHDAGKYVMIHINLAGVIRKFSSSSVYRQPGTLVSLIGVFCRALGSARSTDSK